MSNSHDSDSVFIDDPFDRDQLVQIVLTPPADGNEKARLLILISLIGVVAVAGVVSAVSESYVPIGATWGVLGPVFGRISNYYFPSSNKGT